MQKYKKLADKLRLQITEGQFPSGGKIPSEHDLAAAEGISRQTVRQALAVLEREGLIRKHRGSGSVVAGVSALRRETCRIAVVTTYIGEYIFPEILRGIERKLAGQGFAPTLLATHNRVDSERTILSGLLQTQIDGIIVEGTKTALPNPNIDLYRQLKDEGVPMVFINGYYPDFKPDVYIVADDRAGGEMAADFLLQKGHSSIAGIFKSDDIQGHRRYAGFTEALRRAGHTVVDDHILWYTTETLDILLESSLASVVADCSALVCYNDEVAIKALPRLRELSLDVPGSLAVVGFDDSIFGEVTLPRITSLSLSKETVGSQAAESLLALMAGKPVHPQVLPWKLVEKDST